MRAAVLTSPDGGPTCADFREPEPIGDRPLLDLVAAGMHQVVRSIASGRHYGSTDSYPLVLGVDAVAERPDGTRVYTGFTRSPWGTMAERLATPFEIPLPDGADPLAIAAGMNPAMSGFMPLVAHLEQHGALGTVVVLGATGIAGRAAVQAAEVLGAECVIAAGRDHEMLEELASLGAEPVALTASAEPLAGALQRGAPSLVLDYVWGPVAESAFAALGRRGLQDDDADISYVQIGAVAGADARVPASLLRSRKIALRGSGAGSMSTERLMAQLPVLMGHLADGAIDVRYTAYPLERIAEAWAHGGRSRAVVTP
ncbi:zinc-binding alcohol dehydrogenase family protein [Microbacterium sp. KUDC0406]|uniref:quinone oxidoreductase family protein n=1 Tax=Microbacterium sp. KUDC0406 TaxID=2909588 RepID=UPI001F29460E|nr:zinc-binding alcohol dehydrogenase family protein [Microbacterium sp. KUDC0406]UJP09871.1 zinc-binding alcohol dehydrogenase family protein [Microbacterium sp. KUDC0406]